ncbi:hypothetical protein T12_11723, partial [Trichinella patagoniensis]
MYYCFKRDVTKLQKCDEKKTPWGGLYPNNLSRGFISFPIAQINIAKYVTFLSISHQIRVYTTSDQ